MKSAPYAKRNETDRKSNETQRFLQMSDSLFRQKVEKKAEQLREEEVSRSASGRICGTGKNTDQSAGKTGNAETGNRRGAGRSWPGGRNTESAGRTAE